MHKKLLFLLVAIAMLVTACGGGNPQMTLNDGDSLSFAISDCLTGQRTTLINDVDGIGPAGVRFRGVDGLLNTGDEILRKVDCGNGDETFAFGKVISVNASANTVTIEQYAQPVKR